MKYYYVNSVQNRDFINLTNFSFCEKEILQLQKQFLISQKYYYKVQNKNQGRLIINSILNSLNYYQSIACLTQDSVSLQNNIFDLYKFLWDSHYLDYPEKNLISFFFDNFNFDFLWIEETEFFLSQSWYNLFNKYVSEFNLYKDLPILYITY